MARQTHFARSRTVAPLLIIGLSLAACGGSSDREALRGLISLATQAQMDRKFPEGAHIANVVLTPGADTEENDNLLRMAVGADDVVDRTFLNDVRDELATIAPTTPATGTALTLHLNVTYQRSRSYPIRGATHTLVEHYVVAVIGHDERGGDIAMERHYLVREGMLSDVGRIRRGFETFAADHGLSIHLAPDDVTVSMNAADFPGEVRMHNTAGHLALSNRISGDRPPARTEEEREARRAVIADRSRLERRETALARTEGRTAPGDIAAPLWLSSFGERNGAEFHLRFLAKQYPALFQRLGGEIRETGLSGADDRWAVVFPAVPAREAEAVCEQIEDNEWNCAPTPG